MKKYDYDLLIIGGGSAGLSLASMSAKLGVTVALIDAENLGGDCLHYGCVPSKTLIQSAKIAHVIKHSAGFGVSTKEQNVEWSTIIKRIQDVINTIVKHADNPERFRALGCDVFTQTKATFIDAHTVDIGTKHITGKKIAICTGTRPTVPNVPGLEQVQYLTNETIFNLATQPKSLLILGAGPIGAELGQAFARLGTKVTIVNTHDSLLQKEDPDIQECIKNVFINEGIHLELGWKPLSITELNTGIELTITKNGDTKVLQAERILVAVGRTSNADTLAVDKAGVALDERGYIQTNTKLQTTKKHIYAAGDSSGHLQFTHSAGYEAGIVLANAILHIPATVKLGTIPWTTFTDPEIASCGINETTAKKQGKDYTVTKFNFAHQDRALVVGATNGFIKVLHTKKGTILGCQIIGEHAGELIAEWALAYTQKIKLSTIARTTHVYPTLAGANQQVAGLFSSSKFFTPFTRRILRLLFGYRNTKIESYKESNV